jgi:hypothetical protein
VLIWLITLPLLSLALPKAHVPTCETTNQEDKSKDSSNSCLSSWAQSFGIARIRRFWR